MKTFKNIIIILLTLICLRAVSQEMPDYTLYNNNMVLLNPAYTGTTDGWAFAAGYRRQWLSFNGAPSVFNFSGHGYLRKYKVGVGLTAWQFSVGAVKQNAVSSSYSYRIPMDKMTFTFGLTAQLVNFRTNYAGADLNGINDPLFANDVNQTKFNSGAGVFLYSDKFYAGVSVPVLMTYQSDANAPIKLNRHFLVTGGYVYTINEKFTVKPNALIKIVPESPLAYNVAVNAFYHEQFGLGLMYKSNQSLAIMLDYIAIKSIFISYAYELPGGGSLKSAQSGSQEIMISYLLAPKGTKNERVRYY